MNEESAFALPANYAKNFRDTTLVHISELTAGKRLNHPSDMLRAGQIVNAQALAIDTDERLGDDALVYGSHYPRSQNRGLGRPVICGKSFQDLLIAALEEDVSKLGKEGSRGKK